MAQQFRKRRWRRPERLTLEHPPVVRRKDLGASEPVVIEPDLARKASRRRIEILLVAFVVLCALEGFAIGLLFDAPVAGPAIGAGYAVFYFFLGREFGDGWLVRACKAKPLDSVSTEGSARIARLVAGEARGAAIPAPRLLVAPGSVANAFSFALRRRWLVVTEGTDAGDELVLEGMFAHEVIHLRDGDASVAGLFVILAGAPELVVRGAGLLALLSIPIWPVSLAMRMTAGVAMPEDREVRADVAGALLTRYPPGVAEALREAGGGPSPLRVSDPFWFVHRSGGRGPDADRRAELLEEM
jgi:heat shock protein HtpX